MKEKIIKELKALNLNTNNFDNFESLKVFDTLEKNTAFKDLLKSDMLKDMSIESFVQKANNWLENFAKEHKVELEKIRRLSQNNISNMIKNAIKKNGIILMMRHGEQATNLDETEKELWANSDKLKILKMQEKHNENDDLTKKSAVEFATDILTCAYVKAQIGFSIEAQYSKNYRASILAITLALFLNAKHIHNPIFDCINYPSSDEIKEKGLGKYLKADGAIEWKQENIDAVCGEGKLQKMTQDIKKFLNEIPKETIHIIITHTQQTNISCQLNRLPIVRLGELGSLVIYGDNSAVLYPSGFHNEKPGVSIQNTMDNTIHNNKPQDTTHSDKLNSHIPLPAKQNTL